MPSHDYFIAMNKSMDAKMFTMSVAKFKASIFELHPLTNWRALANSKDYDNHVWPIWYAGPLSWARKFFIDSLVVEGVAHDTD